MKRIVIALAAGIIATAAIPTQEAQAGRFGFRFSPIFLPKPQFYSHSYRSRDWDDEDKYEARARRYRAQRFNQMDRRSAAIQARKQKEAARRQAAAEAAERRLAEKRARITAKKATDQETETTKTTEVAPPPVPTRKVTVANAPFPTEAVLTNQESGTKFIPPVASFDQAEVTKPAPPAELTCKQFLPGAGITISIPCSK